MAQLHCIAADFICTPLSHTNNASLHTPNQTLQGAPAPPAGTFDDADDAADWVSSLLDAQLEAVDDSLGEARRAAEQPASEAAAAQAPPAAQRGRSSGGFTSYMAPAAQAAPRPQERFADATDNSRTPFVHKLDSLVGVIDVEAAEAAAAAAAAAGAQRPHPLAARLEALAYPAWQLEVGEAVPPKSNEETPFTYIDSVPALRAAGALGGCAGAQFGVLWSCCCGHGLA